MPDIIAPDVRKLPESDWGPDSDGDFECAVCLEPLDKSNVVFSLCPRDDPSNTCGNPDEAYPKSESNGVDPVPFLRSCDVVDVFTGLIELEREGKGDHTVILPCGHSIHVKCLQATIASDNYKCPHCRAVVFKCSGIWSRQGSDRLIEYRNFENRRETRQDREIRQTREERQDREDREYRENRQNREEREEREDRENLRDPPPPPPPRPPTSADTLPPGTVPCLVEHELGDISQWPITLRQLFGGGWLDLESMWLGGAMSMNRAWIASLENNFTPVHRSKRECGLGRIHGTWSANDPQGFNRARSVALDAMHGRIPWIEAWNAVGQRILERIFNTSYTEPRDHGRSRHSGPLLMGALPTLRDFESLLRFMGTAGRDSSEHARVLAEWLYTAPNAPFRNLIGDEAPIIQPRALDVPQQLQRPGALSRVFTNRPPSELDTLDRFERKLKGADYFGHDGINVGVNETDTWSKRAQNTEKFARDNPVEYAEARKAAWRAMDGTAPWIDAWNVIPDRVRLVSPETQERIERFLNAFGTKSIAASPYAKILGDRMFTKGSVGGENGESAQGVPWMLVTGVESTGKEHGMFYHMIHFAVATPLALAEQPPVPPPAPPTPTPTTVHPPLDEPIEQWKRTLGDTFPNSGSYRAYPNRDIAESILRSGARTMAWDDTRTMSFLQWKSCNQAWAKRAEKMAQAAVDGEGSWIDAWNAIPRKVRHLMVGVHSNIDDATRRFRESAGEGQNHTHQYGFTSVDDEVVATEARIGELLERVGTLGVEGSEHASALVETLYTSNTSPLFAIGQKLDVNVDVMAMPAPPRPDEYRGAGPAGVESVHAPATHLLGRSNRGGARRGAGANSKGHAAQLQRPAPSTSSHANSVAMVAMALVAATVSSIAGAVSGASPV